jgi:small subunit ribosomal protein S9
MEVIKTIGRRKTAIARAYLSSGKGEIKVNNRDFKDYFPSEVLQIIVKQPLITIEQNNNFNININVFGGGLSSQAEAIRLSIARALVELDPESRTALKAEGFLTRDSRMVERKKYGRRKARRAFQFSKR